MSMTAVAVFGLVRGNLRKKVTHHPDVNRKPMHFPQCDVNMLLVRLLQGLTWPLRGDLAGDPWLAYLTSRVAFRECGSTAKLGL